MLKLVNLTDKKYTQAMIHIKELMHTWLCLKEKDYPVVCLMKSNLKM